ncbi:MAG: hypothetical protein ABIP48_33680, partial [Planctomycetota bacterium]
MNLFVFVPMLGLLLSHLPAADWPRFRGPHGNGISDEKLTLLPDGPQQIWETSVGYGYAGSPLLWEDLVILNVGTGLALQRNTGAVVWQHEGLAGLATPVLYLEGG